MRRFLPILEANKLAGRSLKNPPASRGDGFIKRLKTKEAAEASLKITSFLFLLKNIAVISKKGKVRKVNILIYCKTRMRNRKRKTVHTWHNTTATE